MPDEKRIKDFEPATEILNDDWFAVDSPSQGTRKMQASMFQEGLQTQITTNTENIALHSGQISVLQQGVGNIGDKVDVLDAAITVEEYSATKLYAVDEDCVYEGVRYKCITAIESPEAFTPSHWQAISIEGELNELNSSLANLSNVAIKNFFNTPTINIDIGEVPTSSKVALALLYNANQGTMCLIKLETSPVITSVFGTKTYTITRNGSSFTITPNGTLWGITTVIISKNF